MSKRSVKVISIALSYLILWGMSAGCADMERRPATPGGSDTQTAAPEPEKNIILKYATWDYAVTPEVKALVDGFQREYPDIKVEPTDIAAKDYPDKIVIMLASGDDTDVIGVKDMPSFSGYIDKKQIIALDEYIARDKLDFAAYTGVLEDIRYQGKLYQLPYRSDFWVLYYNKDIFTKAKVPFPGEDMTFEQFRELAGKVTGGEGNDKIYGAYVHTWKSSVMNWPVANHKGTLADGSYDFVKPAYRTFLAMQNEDASVMDFATAKMSSAHYRLMFESGKVAMLLMGTGLISSLIQDKKEGKHNVDWGMVSGPHFSGAKAGTTFGTVTGNTINALSKNKEAAWQFVKYAATEKGAAEIAGLGMIPAYRTQSVLDRFTGIAGFPQDSRKALETDSVVLEFPPCKYGEAIDKALQEEHESIMIGKHSIDAGIKEMNRRIREILEGKVY